MYLESLISFHSLRGAEVAAWKARPFFGLVTQDAELQSIQRLRKEGRTPEPRPDGFPPPSTERRK